MSEPDLSLTPNQEIILAALRYRRRYGLEIIKAIEESGGKHVRFNSLYPNLKKLEGKGLVTSEWGDDPPDEHTGARRKYYRITGLGLKALDLKQQLIEAVAQWVAKPEGA